MKVFEDAPVEWFQHFSRLLESGICVDPEQLQKLQQCMRAAQVANTAILRETCWSAMSNEAVLAGWDRRPSGGLETLRGAH